MKSQVLVENMAHMLCELAENASRAPTKEGRGARDKCESKQTLRFSSRYGAMPSQPQLQVSLYVRPFAGKYAVKNRVARRAVAARRVMTDDAVFLRAQSLHRPLRCQGENVRHHAPRRDGTARD